MVPPNSAIHVQLFCAKQLLLLKVQYIQCKAIAQISQLEIKCATELHLHFKALHNCSSGIHCNRPQNVQDKCTFKVQLRASIAKLAQFFLSLNRIFSCSQNCAKNAMTGRKYKNVNEHLCCVGWWWLFTLFLCRTELLSELKKLACTLPAVAATVRWWMQRIQDRGHSGDHQDGHWCDTTKQGHLPEAPSRAYHIHTRPTRLRVLPPLTVHFGSSQPLPLSYQYFTHCLVIAVQQALQMLSKSRIVVTIHRS